MSAGSPWWEMRTAPHKASHQIARRLGWIKKRSGDEAAFQTGMKAIQLSVNVGSVEASDQPRGVVPLFEVGA